ncbi:MAG: c-type cytochrome [Chloroflexi bacterium]|nr:c-type cytochrome [Chloroflexota bacterium]
MVFGVLAGIVLLVLLAFAVAYASGWSPRPQGTAPPAEPETASAIGMERKIQVVIAAVLAIGALLVIYGINEPNRQATAFARQREQAIDRGMHAFAQYCVPCHGYNGAGAIVPGQGVQAANLTVHRATGDRDEDRKTLDLLVKTITRGRPGTAMPAWGLSDGGSLNDEEIREIATFIMYGDWSEVEPIARAGGGPTPIVPEVAGGGAARARGLFASKGCAACHTIEEIPTARGNVGPNLSQLGTRAGQDGRPSDLKAYIRQSILQPSAFIVPGFPNAMPPFQEVPDGTQAGPNQFTTSDLDLLVDYLSKLGTPEQGQVGTSGGEAGAGPSPQETPAAGGATPAPAGGAPGQPVPPTPAAASPGGAQPSGAAAPGGAVTTPATTQLPLTPQSQPGAGASR